MWLPDSRLVGHIDARARLVRTAGCSVLSVAALRLPELDRFLRRAQDFVAGGLKESPASAA